MALSTLLPDSGPSGLLGSTEPRLWTRPLVEGPPGPCGCGCALTTATSYGFAVEAFAAEVLGEPLDPWQKWAAVHAGELLPDGRPRFRRLLLLVSRQNGKSHLCKVLALYWLFVEQWALVVGMSTNLDYAREAWEKAVDTAESAEALAPLVPKNGVRRANGEQTLTTVDRCRYKIAASNRRGGRSLSIDRLISDELREQASWEAYNAAYPALSARPFGQAIFVSNQGDDSSVVLNSLRESALGFIDSGQGDERLGLFEWSAPDGCDLDDPEALAQANPNVGRRLDWPTLLGPARQAKLRGGEEEAGFRTEQLCQRVATLNAAVSPYAWALCRDPLDLAHLRSRLALCLDVALDSQHATAAVAVVDGARVRVEVVAAFDGPRAADELRRALPDLLRRIRPAVLGWFPAGPAAALAADLTRTRTNPDRDRPVPVRRLHGVPVEAIRADVAAVCVGFAEQVQIGALGHPGDPLLDAHVLGADRLPRGDAWVFSRRNGGHCDAAYAAAGAVHLVRTLPASLGSIRVVLPRSD